MKRYHHLFFDLDHTLWDCDRCSNEVLSELHTEHQLADLGIDCANWLNRYNVVNHVFWTAYEAGQMTEKTLREEKFPFIFRSFGFEERMVPHGLQKNFEDRFAFKPYLVPHALDLLGYLHSRYKLHILTNGFERQIQKLQSGAIHHFFEEVISTHRTGGLRKPDPRIFRYALEVAGAEVADSMMIGDTLATDIKGAQQLGIDTIFYNRKNLVHSEKPTYEVFSLQEIKHIL
jgi:YjjG family noncanonical pyrimidine nucleotidase